MAGEGLEISVSVPCPEWDKALPTVEDVCRRAARAAYEAGASAKAPGWGRAEASLVLADDDFIRALNRDYRGQDRPTNVLSFANRDGAPPPQAPVLLGDVVVAYETATAEAEDGKKRLADHLCHLVVHGMLHLLGHDHETNEQARRMERLEVRALSRIGVPNPYEDRRDR